MRFDENTERVFCKKYLETIDLCYFYTVQVMVWTLLFFDQLSNLKGIVSYLQSRKFTFEKYYRALIFVIWFMTFRSVINKSMRILQYELYLQRPNMFSYWMWTNKNYSKEYRKTYLLWDFKWRMSAGEKDKSKHKIHLCWENLKKCNTDKSN